jgi:FAD/FMN-containing dehydrogenase
MSHYMAEVRMAAYDAEGKPCIYVWNTGNELRAARCALGCMGIILSVRFRCIRRYEVAETLAPCATLDEVLAKESEFPLQQFYLLPHRWTYLAQLRTAMDCLQRRRWSALLYRAYWFLWIDIGLHIVLKLLVSVLKRPAFVRFFYQHLLLKLIPTNRTVVDRDHRMLVMEHELFRHLEIEIFVPARHLRKAADFVREILAAFDSKSVVITEETTSQLKSIGLDRELEKLRGTFTHHYPVTFRRVLADDTLISMSSGKDEPYYAISFITYDLQRDSFFALASFLARTMTRLFAARLHWGKHYPLRGEEIDGTYPDLPEFRRICKQVDPNAVFRNAFTERLNL